MTAAREGDAAMTAADELRTAEARLRQGDPRIDDILAVHVAALLYACTADHEGRPKNQRDTYLDTAALALARHINGGQP
jgi:hypothetical protein